MDKSGWVRRVVIVAVMASVVLLGGCQGEATDEFSGTVLETPYPVADAVLETETSPTWRLDENNEARLTLVFFGYSHCPAICGTVLTSLAQALNRLTEDERAQVEVVFVTTDPTRDTIPALDAYLNRFDPTFVGVTGQLDEIVRLGESMKVYVADGDKLPTGGYDLNTHSTHISGVDKSDDVVVVWQETTSPGEFTADIATLLGPSG